MRRTRRSTRKKKNFQAAAWVTLLAWIVLVLTSQQDAQNKAIQLAACLMEVLNIWAGRGDE